MVQTRSETRRAEFVQGHEGNGIQSSVMPAQLSSTKKSTTVKRRRRREPGELCRLNLDVLFLLAAYMHPIDLLNLSRTCKSLRELLMDRASTFVWKTSRRQIEDLPDCPPDLTEPEYANLIFYARCHNCGKYAKSIFWGFRRRYCPDCRLDRLCAIGNCDRIFWKITLLPTERLKVAGRKNTWVDKEQMMSFMDEYNRCSDKGRLLREKKEQCLAINLHAEECLDWERTWSEDRREALHEHRKERASSIFDRLKNLGFKPEIDYFGFYGIRGSYESFFKKPKPLDDKEWTRALPKWLKIMDTHRLGRLVTSVYPQRERLLESVFNHYVTHATPDVPNFDLLPHVHDLGRFPPFQDIIRAPEGVEMGDRPFEAAFAQLPGLVDDWRKKLDAELAELVQIPDQLSLEDTSETKGCQTAHTQLLRPTTRKLNLACAVFAAASCTIYAYPDVLHIMKPPPYKGDEDDKVSFDARFHVTFLKDAPYIVYACGLDPNIATVEDMDTRNARLKCLTCKTQRFRSWRDALLHSWDLHFYRNPEPNQWQVIGDEHMDAIRSAELSAKTECTPHRSRCLLCRSHIGDSIHSVPLAHLISYHGVKGADVKMGVHYQPLGIQESCSVMMVEEGVSVTFKDPVYRIVQ